jgi:hypothetical protein
MKTLQAWRRELSAEARAALQDVIDAQRSDLDDLATRDALLDAFMLMLNEEQLAAFSRLLRELTEVVH